MNLEFKLCLFFVLIFNTENAYSQVEELRLDIVTESDEFRTIRNKVPNRVNYYSKSKNNTEKCICNLQSSDKTVIKKLSDYEYEITPLIDYEFGFESIVILENCNGKIIDSFIIDVLPAPRIKLFENTLKNHIPSGYKESDDGTLDSLFFYINYGFKYRSLERKLNLNIVSATINLIDTNCMLIDTFIITQNNLTTQQRQLMRRYYLDKKYAYSSILINEIHLVDKNGVHFTKPGHFILPVRAQKSLL